jgi:hypothetical protein
LKNVHCLLDVHREYAHDGEYFLHGFHEWDQKISHVEIDERCKTEALDVLKHLVDQWEWVFLALQDSVELVEVNK